MSRMLTLALILTLAASALAAAAPPARKLLIEYGWDVPGPVYVAEHIRQMEARPFDGLIMRVPKIGQIFEERDPTGPEVEAAFAALPQIRWRRFTDNFICMYAASQMDWFSDQDWQWVLRNVTLCARAARLGRCKGVCFDAEPYGKNPWHYEEQPRAREKTFAEYQAQVRRRGAQFMDAIEAELPSPVVHTFFLLSLFGGGVTLESEYYGLLPAFLNGMLDAADSSTIITDGNENAYYYTSSQPYFAAARRIHQDSLRLVAPENRAKYRRQVQCAQALYVDHLFGMRQGQGYVSNFMTPEQRAQWFEHNTYWALRTSDRYVWLYSERMNWWTGEGVPPGLEQAVIAARARLEQGKPPAYRLEQAFAAAQRQRTEILRTRLGRREAALAMLSTRPVIDGRLDDPAWQQATDLGEFQPMFEREPLVAGTWARVGYDGRALYIALQCREPEMDKLQATGQGRDGNVYAGDVVEIFLAPQGPDAPYYHISINPDNVRWDARQVGDSRVDTRWNPEYESATARGEGEWTVELAIPWQALKVKPRARATLTANLARERHGGELSAWSQLVIYFAEPHNYGKWTLGPGPSGG